jgi:hypothetical protein
MVNLKPPEITMATSHQITIDGNSFLARRGELLLDAALSNGIDGWYPAKCGAAKAPSRASFMPVSAGSSALR